MTFINPFTAKCGQRQISTKIPNFIFYSFDKQIASCESTDRELSFEWSHHRISSTHSKGRVTLQNSIKHFGSERVKKVTNGNNKYCGTSRKRPLKIRRFSARLRKVVAYEYPTRGWISFQMSEHIYILEENSLHAIFKLRYIYSFMLSLKVRFIPYSSYIQRKNRSNYASSSRLQEYENNGNSETVKQKSGCGRFREVVEHGRSIAKT